VSGPFLSYAQNGEDVILWRALSSVERGRYVDVGANHPRDDSVTKAFYDRGWSGLNVEPVVHFAALLREARPRDILAEVAVSDSDDGEVVLHEFAGTGLSTLREEYVPGSVDRGFGVQERSVPTRRLQSLVKEHLAGETVHFCKIDVEGAEAEVLASVDLTTWRPWVLVVESTRPNSTEPTHGEWEGAVLAAGYRFCLFDGVSRYYVSEDKAELAPALSFPACALDNYVRASTAALRTEMDQLHEVHHAATLRLQQVDQVEAAHTAVRTELEREISDLRSELVRWRGTVLERWAAAMASGAASRQSDDSRAELEAIRRTVSWRVTAPLRVARARQRGSRG
jgi:FkbM family methyltransferase